MHLFRRHLRPNFLGIRLLYSDWMALAYVILHPSCIVMYTVVVRLQGDNWAGPLLLSECLPSSIYYPLSRSLR